MTDYIVIGAGSAGAIIAARLSEDANANVVLIEAGGRDSSFLYHMPAGYLGLVKAGMGNWCYETVPQPGLNGRTMYFPRGKVLGGSSSINALVFVRGNAGDFDGWAESGAQGWSYRECLPYFKKLESFEKGEDPYRGGNGPIGVSAGPPIEDMSDLGQAVIRAGIEAGYRINPDYNGATQEGFGSANSNIANGRRQSTASTYLAQAAGRPNFRIISSAHVTRILFEKGRAVGVEYISKKKLHRLDTGGEIILSGGAVHSPQLLQLSGVGPAALLRAAGVDVVVDLPGVGENLQDHLTVNLQQEITKPWSELGKMKPLNTIKALAQYALFTSGPTTSNGQEILAFLKSDNALAEPDIQFHFPKIMVQDHGRIIIKREGITAVANFSRPRSRGTVRISSADPRQAPVIDPKYFSDPEDIRITREAIRMGRDIFAQPAFDDLRGPEFAPGEQVQSDEDLDQYIRDTIYSGYHACGTCKMGVDELAVVDPTTLKVRGIDGLRVADASIMPAIVSGNTNAASMMIGEKAADLIKGISPAMS
ncbi:choline dehydrogenase [Sphingobium sp. JS3065]|uniref:GMC family oxidoreductase n=1 Tax=Sphingobium sp. JS3065 TaxID=2970925 RepID=UPI002264A782|nr:choline dehydrogenase [Sphingobium sp. JS3065]UZW56405.1 choline dehydrogenase [Sphingobium sp. JS3065]